MMNLFRLLFGPEITSLNPEQAQKRIKSQPRPLLLDVRQPSEFRQGHIAGAKLIPLGDLGNALDTLPRDREILCVCRSGSRSHSAAKRLVKAGFQASNLAGGMLAWQHQRLPVQKGER